MRVEQKRLLMIILISIMLSYCVLGDYFLKNWTIEPEVDGYVRKYYSTYTRYDDSTTIFVGWSTSQNLGYLAYDTTNFVPEPEYMRQLYLDFVVFAQDRALFLRSLSGTEITTDLPSSSVLYSTIANSGNTITVPIATGKRHIQIYDHEAPNAFGTDFLDQYSDGYFSIGLGDYYETRYIFSSESAQEHPVLNISYTCGSPPDADCDNCEEGCTLLEYCNYENAWTNAGETGIGEYNFNDLLEEHKECCGDDPGEFLIDAGPGLDPICCDNKDSGGIDLGGDECVVNGICMDRLPESEICDYIDNDCNGQIDNGVTTRYYYDMDNDGYGDPNNYIDECVQQPGTVLNDLDCNDDDSQINPDSEEICDGMDNDCNGERDETCICGELDLAVLADTSASFDDEWQTLEDNFGSILQEYYSRGIRVNEEVYALNPTYTGEACHGKVTMIDDFGACTEIIPNACMSSGCGTLGTEYYSFAQFHIIDGYSDSINCAECTTGISKAPSEAWGVGSNWIIDNFAWRPDATKILFFIGDSLPTGGGLSDYYEYDFDVADNIKNNAFQNEVAVFGMYGNFEYTATDNFGDPTVNDAQELMDHVVSNTHGSLTDYSALNDIIIDTIVDETLAEFYACGPYDDTGECQRGVRTCNLEEGWSDCEGAIWPEPETCDGLDNDCDGNADNGGNLLCDDGLECTTDICNGAAGCEHIANDNLCGNGDYCDGAEVCNVNLGCVEGTAPDCSDGVSCTEDSCNEATDSCDNIPLNSICDNGDYCDGAEVCDPLLGCQAGFSVDCDDGVTCTDDSCDEVNDQCVNTADDANCNDGEFCNGQETCDTIQDCQAGTIVDCEDGVTCTVDSCNEATDSCDNIPDDALCDDGLWCDGTERCDITNDCQAGAAVDCSDGVSCTDDSCDEANDQCVNTADDANCNDGEFCNGQETCDTIQDCQPGTVPDCSDIFDCTDDSCDEEFDMCNFDNTGCDCPGGTDEECDDGSWCNGQETCNTATLMCEPGEPAVCDDGISCTQDSCNEATDSCDFLPDNSVCDNGQWCDGAETCDVTLDCQPGIAIDCSDGVSCTEDSCDEANDQCVNTANDLLCDNGAWCDGIETCDSLEGCQEGVAPDCDDSVGCTDDSCDEVNDRCINGADDNNCDDGLFCNGEETCDNIQDCQAGTIVDCEDGVACTDDSCDETNDVCDHQTNDAYCDNGQWCDGTETCDLVNGCQLGNAVDCSDGVTCTDDSCDEVNDQCVNSADDDICDNGAWCDGEEYCDVINDCTSGPIPICDDLIECTEDFCDELNDMCNANVSDCGCPLGTDEECDDGLFCNGQETCNIATLTCEQGEHVMCDDAVACTDNSCNEDTDSCEFTPDDDYCDDSLFCNGEEICDINAGCVSGSPIDCDDGVSCTEQRCNESTDRCDITAVDSLCDDGQWCDGIETCDAVLDCQQGNVVTCDDGIGCTVDSCDEDIDSCSFAADDILCDNGQYCDGEETCDLAFGCLQGTAVSCSDGLGCTVDSCNESIDACEYTAEDILCDDGLWCNGIETCDIIAGCQAGISVDCDDNVSCTIDECDEINKTCIAIADDDYCDNGYFCDGKEYCDFFLGCQDSNIIDCNDYNESTIDFCNETSDQCEYNGMCRLSDAYWVPNPALNGSEAEMYVQSENCIGELLDFDIWEYDLWENQSYDDNVTEDPARMNITSSLIHNTWTAIYDGYENHSLYFDPEYYFVASLISNSSVLVVSDLLNVTLCWDNDNDSYTDAACGGNDCNDNNPSIYPGAAETCGDGIDQDCDGNDEACAPTPPPPGGGGGGGAPPKTNPVYGYSSLCIWGYECTDWGECQPNNKQVRKCLINDACREEYLKMVRIDDPRLQNLTRKPPEEQDCVYDRGVDIIYDGDAKRVLSVSDLSLVIENNAGIDLNDIRIEIDLPDGWQTEGEYEYSLLRKGESWNIDAELAIPYTEQEIIPIEVIVYSDEKELSKKSININIDIPEFLVAVKPSFDGIDDKAIVHYIVNNKKGTEDIINGHIEMDINIDRKTKIVDVMNNVDVDKGAIFHKTKEYYVKNFKPGSYDLRSSLSSRILKAKSDENIIVNNN